MKGYSVVEDEDAPKPPFPTGLILCTVATIIIGAAANAAWSLGVAQDLAAFEQASALVLEESHSNSSITEIGIRTTVDLAGLVMLNAFFGAAFLVAMLMAMHALAVRSVASRKVIGQSFALRGSWACTATIVRELYLSAPHLIAMSGLLLALLLLFLTCIVALFAGNVSASTWLLVGCALLLSFVMLRVRRGTIGYTAYLYERVLSSPALQMDADAIVGTRLGAIPCGAQLCFLGFGLGMLLLDGALFYAGWVFDEDGTSLPPLIDGSVRSAYVTVILVAKLAFVPVCFLGLTSIVCIIRRGGWIVPGWYKKALYEEDVSMAVQAGTFGSFRAHKERKTVLFHVLAFGTLFGVLLLIPLLAIAIFAVTQFAASSCGAIDVPLAVLDTHPPDFSMLAEQAAPAVVQSV